jgi:ribosomal 50S subunit-associated protein YjgA (DUF615 family)
MSDAPETVVRDPDREHYNYFKGVLAKIWSIVADGERVLNPDADPEYDTNNLYDLVREGAEARKNLAEGKREIEKFIAERTEEAVVEFDAELRESERLRKVIVEYDTVLYDLLMQYCHIDKEALKFVQSEMNRLRPLWMAGAKI